MDEGNFVGMILLDLQKAFDTVGHSSLSKKLQALGLNLSDRHKLVDISGTFSTQGNITCGVPRGSILGPFLFLNLDVCQWYVSRCKIKLLLYADDSVR